MSLVHQHERIETDLLATSAKEQRQIQTVSKALRQYVGRSPDFLSGAFKTCRCNNVANSQFANRPVYRSNLFPRAFPIFVLITVKCRTSSMFAQKFGGPV